MVTEEANTLYLVTLQLDQGTRSCSLEEMVDKYVLDLELVYAKLCVDSSETSEDIVSVKRQEDWKVVSTDKQSTLESLLFLLKKYKVTLQEFPITIFQTLLNEGKGLVSILLGFGRNMIAALFTAHFWLICTASWV